MKEKRQNILTSFGWLLILDYWR